MQRRRAIAVFISGVITIVLLAGAMPRLVDESLSSLPYNTEATSTYVTIARRDIEKLAVKDRAPKTGYERAQFGDGWANFLGCSTREIILYRDLKEVRMANECSIESGVLNDPYTGETIRFHKNNPGAIQIDHVVALSDAWQKGAQALTKEQRIQLANDPLELLAVDGSANQRKSDGDAATWLPSNKSFRCEYIARQIAIKIKYKLWVTSAEKQAMLNVLKKCS